MTAQDKTHFTEKVAQVAETVKDRVEELTEKAKKEFHEADFDNVREPVIRVVEDAKARVDSIKADVKQVAADVQDSSVWKNAQEEQSKLMWIGAALLGILLVLFLRRRSD